MSVTRSRRFGLVLVTAGAILLCLSIPRVFRSPSSMVDFRTAYASSRCLLRHCDPYSPDEVLRLYEAETGEHPPEVGWSGNPYFPTEFAVTVPFALFPIGVAKTLWIATTAALLILSAFLMWDLAAPFAPELAGGLLGVLLAYSEQVIFYGNPAGISVALAVIAVWCFFRDRFVAAGALCFGASLALKPHDTGLLWLFFLFAAGTYRKRALQTLAAAVIIGLPGTLWATHASPDWLGEMRSIWRGWSVQGAMYDPGPGAAAINVHGTCLIANLQALFGLLRDSPHFYNRATYLIFIPMLLAWSVATFRARHTPTTAWLAIAAIAPFSLLPIYHRIYDAKIIMLTIPACALLWAEGGRVGRVALAITAAACVLTGDFVWGIYFESLMNAHVLPTASPGRLLAASINAPLPLVLLGLSVFYLWIYIQRSFQSISLEEPEHLGYAAAPHA